MPKAKTKQRSVTEADKQLGEKIRARRITAEVSQSVLAEALGVSFQQVQKYEKGVNRVSAVRLQQIADALGESVSYFQTDGEKISKAGMEMQALMVDPLNQRICKALAAIRNQAMRHQFVRLLESVSEVES